MNNEMIMEALMVGFIPKEGETEPTIMTVEEMMEADERELKLAIATNEKYVMASYVPAKKRAVRRKATTRHNKRDLELSAHIRKDYGVKVREFPDGTIRVMSTKFHRHEHIPMKQEKAPRYGINSYLKEYGLY